MTIQLTLAGLALAIATSASISLAPVPTSAAPASFGTTPTAPVCQFGFLTIEKKSWILKCQKTVPMAQKGVALTQAGNANCTPNSYWNFGPAVAAQHLPGNLRVRVTYTCGHVEG